jgi:hypothetical protein
VHFGLRLAVAVGCAIGLAVGAVGQAPDAAAAAAPPEVSRSADGWHVNASLAGTQLFMFVIKTAGQPDKYVGNQPAQFLIDPWIYGGLTITVSARAEGPQSNPWASALTFTARDARPAIARASDGWHVEAYLPGTQLFVFVIKVAGQPDKYVGNQSSPFLIDPWIYGGKAVSVSARGEGAPSNPWASALTFTARDARPAVSLAPDGWHVNAYLPGTQQFVFVIKVAGHPDRYIGGQTAPFAIDRDRYGGRSIFVGARAEGPPENPWAAPGLNFIVPAVKVYGIADAQNGRPGSGVDAKALGITLNRIDFGPTDSFAEMDAKVAADAASGLTPLIILVEYYRPISQWDQAQWQQWASAVVARYGPGGTFWQGRTDGQYAPTYFEVLNEPYGWWFYPTPEPAAYATFFADVATAAKVANPRAKFLLASSPHNFKLSANGPWSSQSWDDMVKSAPDGPRAVLLADGVTVHPYGSYTHPSGWPTAVATHQNFPQLPVWITEVGYNISATIDGVTVTEDVQAQWMTRSLTDFASWPWAQGYLWFKWSDYGPDNMWGVVRPDGSHRPSYDAFRNFIATQPS